jgi:hypothetical protein
MSEEYHPTEVCKFTLRLPRNIILFQSIWKTLNRNGVHASVFTSSICGTSQACKQELLQPFWRQKGRWYYICKQIHVQLLERSWRSMVSARKNVTEIHSVFIGTMVRSIVDVSTNSPVFFDARPPQTGTPVLVVSSCHSELQGSQLDIWPLNFRWTY